MALTALMTCDCVAVAPPTKTKGEPPAGMLLVSAAKRALALECSRLELATSTAMKRAPRRVISAVSCG